MQEGQVYRWNGRTLVRDRAYERRVAAWLKRTQRQIIIHPGGNIRL